MNLAANLCLPEPWLEFFDDLPTVAVLKAHADAETSPGDLIALSELKCAARTRLHRETVHKKKRELIDRYHVLCPQEGASGRGWRGLPCRIDHGRLHELMGEKPTIETTAAKPTIERPENQQLIAGKPTIERPENQQLIAGKPTIEPPANKERAPAPVSVLAASSYKQLASFLLEKVNAVGSSWRRPVGSMASPPARLRRPSPRSPQRRGKKSWRTWSGVVRSGCATRAGVPRRGAVS